MRRANEHVELYGTQGQALRTIELDDPWSSMLKFAQHCRWNYNLTEEGRQEVDMADQD